MKKQDEFDSATEAIQHIPLDQTILRSQTLAAAGAIFGLSPTTCANTWKSGVGRLGRLGTVMSMVPRGFRTDHYRVWLRPGV